MADIEQLQETIGRVAQSVGPAVVRIGSGWRGGSGLVAAEGQILTNAHNVHDGQVTIGFSDGRQSTGEVTAVDADGDLSVISADTGGATPLPWADTSSSVAIGSAVFAVSSAGDGPRVTFGLVSSTERAFRGPRGRRISGSLEHTAPMARGSSGSPLVDAQGRLVGVNTNRAGDGFYLALPADAALRSSLDSLARGESPKRVHLGVGVAPSGVARRLRRQVGLPERDGLLIREVEDGSPAARAGVAVGDLIVAAAGKQIQGLDDLHDALASASGAPSLELQLVRGTEERTVSVDLAASETPSA